MNLLAWSRSSEGSLQLKVFENGAWKHYRQSNHYQPDFRLSTQSGFRTAQYYLKLGYTYLEQKDGELMEDADILLYWAKYRAANPEQNWKEAVSQVALELRLSQFYLCDLIEEAAYQDRHDVELEMLYGGESGEFD